MRKKSRDECWIELWSSKVCQIEKSFENRWNCHWWNKFVYQCWNRDTFFFLIFFLIRSRNDEYFKYAFHACIFDFVTFSQQLFVVINFNFVLKTNRHFKKFFVKQFFKQSIKTTRRFVCKWLNELYLKSKISILMRSLKKNVKLHLTRDEKKHCWKFNWMSNCQFTFFCARIVIQRNFYLSLVWFKCKQIVMMISWKCITLLMLTKKMFVKIVTLQLFFFNSKFRWRLFRINVIRMWIWHCDLFKVFIYCHNKRDKSKKKKRQRKRMWKSKIRYDYCDNWWKCKKIAIDMIFQRSML